MTETRNFPMPPVVKYKRQKDAYHTFSSLDARVILGKVGRRASKRCKGIASVCQHRRFSGRD